jgi:L-lactate dehydrogenase complex protein LldG
MSARDDILNTIKKRRRDGAAHPDTYTPPAIEGDAVERFAMLAKRAAADVRVLAGESEIPEAVAEVLRARNMPARVHMPEGSSLAGMAWTVACETTPPGPDEAAVTRAPFAIAETGTLAYPAAASEPASWHFRPGLEIAVLKAADILPNMEDVLARVKAKGVPATLNFVTGPSRTGDIEQTLELGAHGPKALVILVVKE